MVDQASSRNGDGGDRDCCNNCTKSWKFLEAIKRKRREPKSQTYYLSYKELPLFFLFIVLSILQASTFDVDDDYDYVDDDRDYQMWIAPESHICCF